LFTFSVFDVCTIRILTKVDLMLMPDAGNIFDCPMDVAVTVSSTIAGTSLSGGSGSFTVPRLFNLF
jgi:hypothetical protein